MFELGEGEVEGEEAMEGENEKEHLSHKRRQKHLKSENQIYLLDPLKLKLKLETGLVLFCIVLFFKT